MKNLIPTVITFIYASAAQLRPAFDGVVRMYSRSLHSHSGAVYSGNISTHKFFTGNKDTYIST